MINTVIFDIGNVLTDFRWKDFIKEFGYDDELNERIGNAAMGSWAWNEFDRGLDEEKVLQGFIANDPAIEKELRIVFKDIGKTLKMFDTTIPWLDELRGQGYRVLILSNLSAKTVRECAKDLVFLDHVDGGILSYRVRMIKPEPDIYKCLIRRYDLTPSECVFLDDREENVNTAKGLGMNGIVFKNRAYAVEELVKLGLPKSAV